MAKIRVTKIFDFEMAHALHNYDGPCRNIHGHSYKLEVTLIGEPIIDAANVKYGMVIDFGDLKRIVNKQIISKFDHVVVLSNITPKNSISKITQLFEHFVIVDYQPTCENLILDFVKRLKPFFKDNIKLHSLKLHETATSFSEWFASDNK